MLVGQKLGPFAIEKELGTGAMGAVYLGRYLKTGARVAVKVMIPGMGISDSAAARFEREADILKQFSHPNIVRLYGVGKSGGNRYYAMEYVEGESLDKVLARRGRFAWEEVLTIGQQLCAALQHAHEQGIIHRDLKPSNLMVLADGTLKLTDFGIAKDMDMTGLTGTHCTVGTAAYMSPEQCRGEQNLTHKSDLYSLGIVMYELITGHKPFNASNAMDMFMRHVKQKPERPSQIILDLPVFLDTLICQLLEKKPEQRPRDAATVYAALSSVKEKVESQRSAGVDAVRAQMFGGDTTAPKLGETDKEISRTLMTGKGKSRKRRKIEPIYRRGWFVIVALIALVFGLVGLIYVINRPPSPEVLHARAARLMKTGKVEDRQAARAYDGPLTVFLRHYGSLDDDTAREMNAWADQVDMEEADELLQNYLRKLQKKITLPANSAREELGFKAARAEQAGELDAAINIWKELQQEAGRTSWGLLAAERLRQLDQIEKFDVKGQEHLQYVRDTGQEPKLNGPELQAFTAFRYEHFADLFEGTNDLAQAQKSWEEMRNKYAEELEQRFWWLLANHRLRSLKSRVPEVKDPDAHRKEIIQKALDGARALQKTSLYDARAVYLHIIALYEEQSILKELVAEARQGLKEVKAKIT